MRWIARDAYYYFSNPARKPVQISPNIDAGYAVFSRITDSDIEDVVGFWPRSLHFLADRPKMIADLVARRLEKGDIGILGRRDGKLITMSWLSFFDFHQVAMAGKGDPAVVCWKNLFVKEDHRKRGLAVLNFVAAQRFLDGSGANLITGFVQVGNTKSRNLLSIALQARLSGILLVERFLKAWRLRAVDIDSDRYEGLRWPTPDTYVK